MIGCYLATERHHGYSINDKLNTALYRIMQRCQVVQVLSISTLSPGLVAIYVDYHTLLLIAFSRNELVPVATH